MTEVLDAMTGQPLESVVDALGSARALLDEKSFLDLYSQTAVPLRGYVISTLGRATDADDVVQEAFLRLLRTPVPVGDNQALRAYLFRVASNLIVDHYRARKHESSSDQIPERAARAADSVVRLDVGRFFRRLKSRERQLIWLAHVEGADHAEIAKILGLRHASVRVLVSRARHRLARLLREHRPPKEEYR